MFWRSTSMHLRRVHMYIYKQLVVRVGGCWCRHHCKLRKQLVVGGIMLSNTVWIWLGTLIHLHWCNRSIIVYVSMFVCVVEGMYIFFFLLLCTIWLQLIRWLGIEAWWFRIENNYYIVYISKLFKVNIH